MITKINTKIDVLPETKLFSLLEAYPELEEFIIGLAPPFKNLRNPLLRKTVGKLANLEKVALIGGFKKYEFINLLREYLGMAPINNDGGETNFENYGSPEWTKNEPVTVINGIELLEQGIHPLNLIHKEMRDMENGRHLVLVTNFLPAPLLDSMEQAGYTCFTEEANDGSGIFRNYIRK